MNWLIISATEWEVDQEVQNFIAKSNRCRHLVTGVGIPATAVAMSKMNAADLSCGIIHVGIAGSFDDTINLGDLVEVSRERYGDLGVDDQGIFRDIYQLDLADPNEDPLSAGWIENMNPPFETELKKVSGITVNTVSGHQQQIVQKLALYHPQIESMEGAMVAHFCKIRRQPYAQIRGISNYVTERNREDWEVDLAVHNLGAYLVRILRQLIP